jgi:anti-sigma regulatory factor (Ser/Thr protein kinase)
MDKSFTSYQVEERSFVSYIKREIHQQASRGKFSEVEVAEIDIIVSEISSNLIKHVGSGELLYRFDEDDNSSTFEIISIDKGKGMDTALMMKDGNSTTKTLGHGLGAIERLSDASQVYSIPGWGTICYAMRTSKKNGEQSVRKNGNGIDLEVRALCVNRPRETVCGDGYRVKRSAAELKIFFGDGLGHGPHAKEAIDRAGDFFMNCPLSDPVEIIRMMHVDVRRTRGLVATIAVLNRKTNEWTICGVGNTIVRMYNGIQYKNYMSYNGTIGLNLPNSMNATTIRAERNQHLIICSDGIQSRWDLSRYPSIYKYDNTVLAAAIYKDYTRGNDDSSVLIAKVI